MGDWFRSVTVLAVAFVGAVVVTIGLANVIVPGGASEPRSAAGDDDGTSAGGDRPGDHRNRRQPTVIGDREGTLTVTRESNEGNYSLVGDGARVVFQGSQPPVISQVSWDGLEFFPDPDACTITPGELDDEIGVGYAESVRGPRRYPRRGTVGMAGTLGLALTTVGESDLPPMGGSVTVGDESWEFKEAFLFGFPVNQGAGTEDYNMVLTDPRTAHSASATTSRPTGSPSSTSSEAARLRPDAAACGLETDELGRLSPGGRDCGAVDRLPGGRRARPRTGRDPWDADRPADREPPLALRRHARVCAGSDLVERRLEAGQERAKRLTRRQRGSAPPPRPACGRREAG